MSFPRTYAAIERKILRKVVETKMARAIVRKGLGPLPAPGESPRTLDVKRALTPVEPVTTTSTIDIPETVIPLTRSSVGLPALDDGKLVVPNGGMQEVRMTLSYTGPLLTAATDDSVYLRCYVDPGFSIAAEIVVRVSGGPADLNETQFTSNYIPLAAGTRLRLAFASKENRSYEVEGGTMLEVVSWV